MWIEIEALVMPETKNGTSCHVCGMWIEIIGVAALGFHKNVMPRMWHVD